jgi:hypothetical protein
VRISSELSGILLASKGRVNSMGRSPPYYLSFVLRLWRTNDHWYVSLVDPLSGERTGFASVERMVAFLHRQMDSVPGSSDIGSGTDSQKGEAQ